MVEPINLRQYKKQKARQEKEKQSQENRIKFGLSKHIKNKDKASNALQEKRLSDHHLQNKNQSE